MPYIRNEPFQRVKVEESTRHKWVNHYHSLGKFRRQQTDDIFLISPRKKMLWHSCKLSPLETIRMKCQILFSGKNTKIFQDVVAENFTQRTKVNLYHSLGKFSRPHIYTGFDIHANCLHWRQFAWNVKSCFLGKIQKYFKMSLLKILPRELRLTFTTPWANSADHIY